MVNTNKVLTVSYGTFSCTLEGFDDSFDTMKAIAEYFRDLAADDRYFGAEPATPDAEMLARIAEKEVSRHVEAHQDGDNIVLRTALPVLDATLEQADRNTDSGDATIAEDAAKVEAEEQVRLAEIAEKEAQDEAKRVADEAEQRAQARAARRARLAEKEAKKLAEKAQADAQEAQDLEIAEQAKLAALAEVEATKKAEAEAEAARVSKAEADAKALADAKAKADAQAEAALTAEAERVAQARRTAEAARFAKAEAAKQAEQQKTVQADAEADSVASKLARIRAVVGKPATASTAPDFSEDEHADDIQQGQPGDTDLEDIIEFDESDQIAETAPSIQNAISDVMPNPVAPTESEVDDNDDTQLTVPIEDVAPVAVEAPKAPIRARVIKMKREEFEAAIASGEIEEEEADDDTVAQNVEAPSPVVEDTSLSRDDEDELARELAAVEAELAGLPDDVHTDDVVDAGITTEADIYVDDANTHARGAEDLASQPDAEMDRLMDQTRSELEEPDGKKRRNTLGHLRAAVASARADKSSNPQSESVDETLTYRDDLESAVQPSRPVRRLTTNANAQADARPPLKLVAEQRVDAPAPAPIAEQAGETTTQVPVRPRRIKTSDALASSPKVPENEVAPEGGTFHEFAEELGATELPDLLEAAAAYLAYVEGKEQFSRPQLMTKVRMVQEENFSREDGLRSFGQLLRQGKIEKISGGRFTVSDRISFKPDTRAVG